MFMSIFFSFKLKVFFSYLRILYFIMSDYIPYKIIHDHLYGPIRLVYIKKKNELTFTRLRQDLYNHTIKIRKALWGWISVSGPRAYRTDTDSTADGYIWTEQKSDIVNYYYDNLEVRLVQEHHLVIMMSSHVPTQTQTLARAYLHTHAAQHTL